MLEYLNAKASKEEDNLPQLPKKESVYRLSVVYKKMGYNIKFNLETKTSVRASIPNYSITFDITDGKLPEEFTDVLRSLKWTDLSMTTLAGILCNPQKWNEIDCTKINHCMSA